MRAPAVLTRSGRTSRSCMSLCSLDLTRSDMVTGQRFKSVPGTWHDVHASTYSAEMVSQYAGLGRKGVGAASQHTAGVVSCNTVVPVQSDAGLTVSFRAAPEATMSACCHDRLLTILGPEKPRFSGPCITHWWGYPVGSSNATTARTVGIHNQTGIN